MQGWWQLTSRTGGGRQSVKTSRAPVRGVQQSYAGLSASVTVGRTAGQTISDDWLLRVKTVFTLAPDAGIALLYLQIYPMIFENVSSISSVFRLRSMINRVSNLVADCEKVPRYTCVTCIAYR